MVAEMDEVDVGGVPTSWSGPLAPNNETGHDFPIVPTATAP